MYCVIAGPMFVEETAFQQVCLPCRTGLINGYGQIVTRGSVRSAHAANCIAIAAPHIALRPLRLKR